MAVNSSRWQWILIASIPLVLAGGVLFHATDSVALQRVAIGIVVVACSVYVTARVAIARGRRSR